MHAYLIIPTRPISARKYRLSRRTWSGRFYHAAKKKSAKKESYFRFLLNDGVVPLTGINHCTANKDGLCKLANFVQGLKERVAEIDFKYDCFANYTVPWPDLIIDGRMKR